MNFIRDTNLEIKIAQTMELTKSEKAFILEESTCKVNTLQQEMEFLQTQKLQLQNFVPCRLAEIKLNESIDSEAEAFKTEILLRMTTKAHRSNSRAVRHNHYRDNTAVMKILWKNYVIWKNDGYPPTIQSMPIFAQHFRNQVNSVYNWNLSIERDIIENARKLEAIDITLKKTNNNIVWVKYELLKARSILN